LRPRGRPAYLYTYHSDEERVRDMTVRHQMHEGRHAEVRRWLLDALHVASRPTRGVP